MGAVVAALAVATALKLDFAQSGYYPFSLLDLGTALGISGVGLVITRAHVRRDVLSALFVVYPLVNIVLFLVPSPVGSNATRLYSIAALPLLWLAARVRTPPLAWRRLISILVVVFTIQVTPVVVSAYHSYQESAAAAATFWRPALSFLRAHRDAGHRVEVVATADHWEAYYLAQAGVSLARGWYRQADFPENQLLYQSTVSPSAYRTWLRALGVKYVLLPDVPLDYSSQAEASLIRSGRSGLRLVGTASHWRFYRLPDSVGIVSGSQSTPRDVHVTAGAVSFLAPKAGSYQIRIRYSPYWRPGGQLACISQTPDGMMRLVARTPGTVSHDARPARCLIWQHDHSSTVRHVVPATGVVALLVGRTGSAARGAGMSAVESVPSLAPLESSSCARYSLSPRSRSRLCLADARGCTPPAVFHACSGAWLRAPESC